MQKAGQEVVQGNHRKTASYFQNKINQIVYKNNQIYYQVIFILQGSRLCLMVQKQIS